MILASTYEDGLVCQHYGDCRQFKLYYIENNIIVDTKIIDSGEYSHRTLAILLHNHNVNALICGNLGTHAVLTLSEQNIEIFNGLSGDCDMLASEYLKGNLTYNPQAVHCCSH